MKKSVAIALAFVMLTPPALSRAADTKAPAAKASDTKIFDDSIVNVEINKGTLVKLPRAASSVVISDPNTADVQVVSPKLVLVRGKKIGETSFYAIDDRDELIVNAVVNVSHNISGLERAIKRAAPDADIGFKTVDGGLVMQGFANDAAESENIRSIAATFVGGNDKMINMIRTNGSDQIMLRVKIMEMSRSNLKRLGTSLQQVSTSGKFGAQTLTGNDILFNTADIDKSGYSLWGNVLERGSSTKSNLLLRYGDYAALIDALETQGLGRVLAEPTLTTTSGQAASFLAGGKYPMPVAGQNGSTTIEYQDYGVSLKFTPVMMNKDRISLTVAPEVSTLDFSNPIKIRDITYPILNTRKASSVVELGSGDSFMLAGLMQSNESTSVSKTPGVSDLPIIGDLFRSHAFQNDQTELVILVTPYVVRPVSAANKLQAPTDGYKPPSDLDLLLNGSLYQQQPMPDESKAKKLPPLHGDGGFILE
jgi:pilus assembly protein CpaC